MVNVCVIDDGIDEKKLGKPLFHDLKVLEDGSARKNTNKKISKYHGTICAQIVNEYYSKVAISSIKLDTDNNRASDSSHLVKALEHCILIDINVIHLSLGSTTYSDFSEIRSIIKKLADQNKVIVAACNNKNIFTVPACLPEVIGVCTQRVMTADYYEVNTNNCDGIDFIASSKHMIGGSLTPYSNSCAAPLITAKVCQYLFNNPHVGLNDVREYLTVNAQNYSKTGDYRSREKLIRENPEKLDYWYNTVIKVKDINNPVVCCYDYDIKELARFKKAFASRGYNCIVVTNRLQENFFVTEYVNFKNAAIIENAVKTLNTVYNPDVLIIGIYDLSDLEISKFVNVDLIFQNGNILTDEGEIITIQENVFHQLFLLLRGEDD